MNHDQIQVEKRYMNKETRELLTRSAARAKVTEDSLVWVLMGLYTNGAIRSRAFSDVPAFVIDDGLVVERDSGILDYIPWTFTDKAKTILTALRDA